MTDTYRIEELGTDLYSPGKGSIFIISYRVGCGPVLCHLARVFLWSYLKSNDLVSKPQNIAKLKKWVKHDIAAILNPCCRRLHQV